MYDFDLEGFCKLCYGLTESRIIDAIVSKERELDGIERAQARRNKSMTFYPYKAQGDKEALGRLGAVVQHGAPPANISDREWEMFIEVWKRKKAG